MSIKEQIKPLEWSKNWTTNTLAYSYRINEIGGKFIVTYCKLSDGFAKEATGFTTLDQAKAWAFNHHCEKMAKWLNPDPLTQTLNWFKVAKPEPTDKDKCCQIGVHYEEVGEMSEALNCDHNETDRLARVYKTALDSLSEAYLADVDKLELLDSLADQIVTAVGVAYMMGFDIIGALTEVNKSNYSKFVNGKAETDENGKIIKGENYFKPDLEPFVGEQND